MENKEKNNIGIIIIFSVIIVILAILCVLFATGTISFKTNDKCADDNNITTDVTNNTIDNIVVNNDVIDKYLGKWLLANQEYSYVNIKKNNDNSGYKIDILVNKEADYKDLELHCADNSGACYFSGDSTHNYSIMMANDTIIVLPDYSHVGYWFFNK